MKMIAVWNIAPCSLVALDRRFRVAYCLHNYCDDVGGSTYLWNVGLLKRNYTHFSQNSLIFSTRPHFENVTIVFIRSLEFIFWTLFYNVAVFSITVGNFRRKEVTMQLKSVCMKRTGILNLFIAGTGVSTQHWIIPRDSDGCWGVLVYSKPNINWFILGQRETCPLATDRWIVLLFCKLWLQHWIGTFHFLRL
jgi:hypothetical protein